MSDGKDRRERYRAVPSTRASRLAGFGRLATGIAGGMMAESVRRLASGEVPRLENLILTPGNALRMAERLSHLRGAAMKLGQMISMDAGDVLPKELSDILSVLREQANFMPQRQLERVLARRWGTEWHDQFSEFSMRPMAAASIGQVHRAVSKDGRELAIKVQYPGVADSIDADVDNVATLLSLANVLPPHLDLESLLAAAKSQLHEEADYRREGERMQHYRAMLADTPGFVVPELDEELTTDGILAMSFEPGIPIESVETEDQDTRNDVARRILTLVSRELFEFGVMQTDPNFANYRYQPESGDIVLLDFGATRDVEPDVQAAYRGMIRGLYSGDVDTLIAASLEAGFVNPAAVERHRERIDRITKVILDEFAKPGAFDFGDRAFVEILRDEGMAIAADRKSWHVPPAETLFVQRKVSGTALLCARLGAKVDVRAILEERLEVELA